MDARSRSPRRGRWVAAVLAAALVAAPAAKARPDPNGARGAQTAPARVVTVDRFDWGDAAIGAGVVAGGLIGLAGLVLSNRPSRRRAEGAVS